MARLRALAGYGCFFQEVEHMTQTSKKILRFTQLHLCGEANRMNNIVRIVQ